MPDTNNQPSSPASSSTSALPLAIKDLLGKSITRFVLWGTAAVGIVGIGIAIVALCLDTADAEKIKLAFTIVQYVFSALLPLWGTWIGTVIAYYYSKENFESANRSVQQLVEKVTSDNKLQSLKVWDVMIRRDKLIVQKLAPGADLSSLTIKENGIDFLEAQGIKRVIILNEKDAALYVVHKELLASFITDETLNGRPVANYTFKDMLEKASDRIKLTFANSVRFVSADASLLEAKKIMDQNKTCQDVFVTQTGNPSEPVLGWVTNVTIAENAIV